MKKIALIALLAIVLGGCQYTPATKDSRLEVYDNSTVGTPGYPDPNPYVYCRHGWVLVVSGAYGSFYDLGEDGKPIPCNRNDTKPPEEKPVH